jgi:phospho-N-acetylmuramoyl-pentapeptide-transferase
LLYWLLYQKLYPFFHPFRIFRYLTFRTAFASLTALLIALLIGPWVIQKLREFQIGQFIRDDGPQSHQKKSGTPTMGGVLIVIAILLPTALWSDPANPLVWITVFSTLAFAAIGFADDYIKVVQRRSLGLTARAKLLWQGLAGALVAIALVVMEQFKLFSTRLTVPFIKSWRPDLLWHAWPATVPHLGVLAFVPFVVWVILILIGSSNSVNLTDGLDGLATGTAILVLAAYMIIGIWQLRNDCTSILAPACYDVRDPQDIAVVAATVMGACAGFLWWNAPPAKIFMGDTGSLALGGALAGLAITTRTELLLLLLGGLFVIITLSVVIQVGSFKLTGKRVFRMAPLQHHFELAGWAETTIVVRFWIIAGICVALGLGIFYVG